MLIVNRHTKGPEGWAQLKSAPIDSTSWDSADRDMIDWMCQNGENVVTIGHDMYEIVTPKINWRATL